MPEPNYEKQALNDLEKAAETAVPHMQHFYLCRAQVYATLTMVQAMDANTEVQRGALAKM